MQTVQYMPPTKRRRMTQPRAARIFRSRNGVCFICRVQIRDGEPWFVEHPDTVNGGGSDDDADLWPAHTRCKPEKDAIDAAEKGKRDRIVTAGWTGKSKSRGFRGWRKFDGTLVYKETP